MLHLVASTAGAWEERLRKLAGMRLALSLFLHREEARGWRGWLCER